MFFAVFPIVLPLVKQENFLLSLPAVALPYASHPVHRAYAGNITVPRV